MVVLLKSTSLPPAILLNLRCTAKVWPVASAPILTMLFGVNSLALEAAGKLLATLQAAQELFTREQGRPAWGQSLLIKRIFITRSIVARILAQKLSYLKRRLIMQALDLLHFGQFWVWLELEFLSLQLFMSWQPENVANLFQLNPPPLSFPCKLRQSLVIFTKVYGQ